MNKEKLFSLMPKVVIKEEDAIKTIEEQKELAKAGKSFVSQLPINQVIRKELADFDIEEIIWLFDELRRTCLINENGMYFNGLDIETFAIILEENFNLDNMYELDNVYIENLLKGKDITKEEIHLYEDVTINFGEALEQFTIHANNLIQMLTVKRALLGSYLAEENVKSLLGGQKEIYDISILM